MADEASAAPPLEKPLPDPKSTGRRPGTSGTELDLRANRQKASSAYQRAQRAEKSYRAKRQASNARRDMKAAKTYYKEGLNQLKLGAACSIRAIKAIPAVLREKRESSREKEEVRKKERAMKKQRKWNEKVRASEDTPAEAAPAAEEPAAA